eukprot:TRINITY_DN153_c0_g1_i4.p1 TRINITY_DN153_c0_g1~~TRINITY_DN153_c0_g1_i4.p1  ORF type:complete len:409 (+),score=75.65 TRINITY_DN153_c0_g1_i4:68-1294(+)
MFRRPPRSPLSSSSAASDVYKRQVSTQSTGEDVGARMVTHTPLPLFGIVTMLFITASGFTPERNNDIHAAIHNGSYEGVQAALLIGPYACNGLNWCKNETKADINSICPTDNSERAGCGPDSQSPLMHATLEGHLEIVKLLLAEGADPSITDKDGYTPMLAAGFIDRNEIGEYLIDHGLDKTAYELRTDAGPDSEDMNGGLLEGHLGKRFGQPTVQRILNYHIDDWNFIPGKGHYQERIRRLPPYRVIRTDGTTEHLHWHNFSDKMFVSNHLKAEFKTDLENQNGWLTEYQEWDYYRIMSHHVPAPSPPPGELQGDLPASVGVFACGRPVLLSDNSNVTLHNHAAVDIELVASEKRDEYLEAWGNQSGWLTEEQETSTYGLNGRHLDWDFEVPFLPPALGTLIEYPLA